MTGAGDIYEMKILAIDYGEKRMGFAIGEYDSKKNTFRYTATLKPLIRKKSLHDLESIKNIISEYDIQKILIGFPLNMNGSNSTMSTKIERFGEVLRSEIGITPEYVDERLSSFEAREMLKELEPDIHKRKNKLDSTAALVILNNYLEKK